MNPVVIVAAETVFATSSVQPAAEPSRREPKARST